MGMAELEKAIKAVRNSDVTDVIGPQDPGLVSAAEQILGLPLPPTYRRFLLELGSCAVPPDDFYGIVDKDFTSPFATNFVWLNLGQRERWGHPDYLVIIGDTGMGEWYVLDTSKRDETGECPVVVWEGGMSKEGDELEFIAPDFGSFLWDEVLEAFGPEY